jgi:hypothetical protein
MKASVFMLLAPSEGEKTWWLQDNTFFRGLLSDSNEMIMNVF